MLKRLILAATCSLTAGTLSAQSTAENRPEHAAIGLFEHDNLSRDIEAILSRHGVPGGHVTITHGPEIIFAQGFGTDPSVSDAPYSAATRGRLASATKVLTALTILSLVEDGTLSLDTTLGELDPELPETLKPLPVWRVLNHTSGIPMVVNRKDFNELPKGEMLAIDIAGLLEMIEGPLDFEPGEGWHYQQSGYAILAHALRQATGMDWQSLVKQHVLAPAGMVETRFTAPGEIAAAYVVEDGKREYFDFAGPALLAPGGGYDTTPGDLARLLVALAQGRILSDSTLTNIAMDASKLHRQTRNVEGEGYGPGLIVQQFGSDRLVGHSGGGGLADIRYAPDRKLGIAILTNRAGGTGVASEVADYLSERYLGPAQRTDPE